MLTDFMTSNDAKQSLGIKNNIDRHYMTKGMTLLIKEFVALGLLLAAVLQVQAQTARSPAEDTSKQSLVASADPRPTPEQIEKGRVLLARIINVLETLPLMDSDAVMKEFGVADVGYDAYPTHVRAFPRNPEIVLRGTGLARLSVSPWERGEGLANLNGLVSPAACIQKTDIDGMLGLPYKAEPIVLVDQGPPKGQFYPTSFSYSIKRSPLLGFDVHVGFSIYSGFCVERFGAVYVNKRSEIK